MRGRRTESVLSSACWGAARFSGALILAGCGLTLDFAPLTTDNSALDGGRVSDGALTRDVGFVDATTDSGPGGPPTDAATIDAHVSTGCLAHWGLVALPELTMPVPVPGLDTASSERDPVLSADGLTMYLSTNGDLFVAKRDPGATSFSAPIFVAELSSAATDSRATISYDDMHVYLSSTRAGGVDLADLWLATRPSPSGAFSPATNLTSINTIANELDPAISPDELRLYYSQQFSSGEHRLVRAVRTTRSDLFGPPDLIPFATLNRLGRVADPAPSADERVLFFSYGGSFDAQLGDIYFALRGADGVFVGPSPLLSVNTDAAEADAFLSTDGCELYFARETTPRNFDIFRTTVVVP